MIKITAELIIDENVTNISAFIQNHDTTDLYLTNLTGYWYLDSKENYCTDRIELNELSSNVSQLKVIKVQEKENWRTIYKDD